MKLGTPIGQLRFVGGKLEKVLHKIGIQTVQDLLLYFPVRYEDYSEVTDINALAEGSQATVRAVIELITTRRIFKRRTYITEAIVSDGTDQLRVVWFGQPYISRTLKVGDEVFLSGKVKSDMLGVQMNSPTYEKIKGNARTTHTARIVPMYRLTKGLTHKQLRFLIKQALPAADAITEWIPTDLQDRIDVMNLKEAVKLIHFPESDEELEYAKQRLKFGELFVLQLRAEMIRQSQKRYHAPEVAFHEEKIQQFVKDLPFTLTKDQKVSVWEIFKDCKKQDPMNRMLEGDVGSGKTVVAAMSLYNTALSDMQSVLMAPTEILAKQHYESVHGLIGEYASVALLTGSELINPFPSSQSSKARKKAELLSFIHAGKIQIVIGTHALLHESIAFHNLALAIIDEQHRFGVEQRKILREKSGDDSSAPHFLSMTATPIPRSFALTVYGDLDLSMIKQMPPGRKAVKTRLVEQANRKKAYDFIASEIQKGRQAFVICPRIGEDGIEQTEKKSVLTEYEKLSKEIFPDLKIAYLHGKMKSKEKDEIMGDFKENKTQILVSTSVIEVGVNIPNATVMMVEDAERFGLAQLHQFRGRVGRSDMQSYCFVFTDSDSIDVIERLSFFEKQTDGFLLAEYDLQRRGPGDVYGKAQSGAMPLKFASMRDTKLIQKARELARDIDFDSYPSLKDKVKEWEDSVHLE